MSYFNPNTGQWENSAPNPGGFPAPPHQPQPGGGFPAPPNGGGFAPPPNQPPPGGGGYPAAPGGFPAPPNQPPPGGGGYPAAPGGFPAPHPGGVGHSPIYPPGGGSPANGFQPPNQPPQQDPNHAARLAAAIAGQDAGGERLPNLPVGQHRVVVESLKMFPGRSNDDFFLANMVLHATTSHEVQVGMRFSYLQKMSGKALEAGMAATKRFLLACCGFSRPTKEDEAKLTAENILAAVNEKQQPFAGVALLATGYDKSKPGEAPFVVYNWEPVPPAQG